MKLTSILALGAALGLAACGGDKVKTAEAPAATATTPAPSAAAGEAPTAVAATFDLSKVPVSTAALAAFPYVPLPAGYSYNGEKTMDLAAFPIWTGAGFLTVEGKVYMANSDTPTGKTYSRLEFERSIENSVKAAGGVQVAKGEAPGALVEKLPDTLRQDMHLGLGSIYGNPITTYVIRRADRTIWIQLVTDTSKAAWAVVEAPAA